MAFDDDRDLLVTVDLAAAASMWTCVRE